MFLMFIFLKNICNIVSFAKKGMKIIPEFEFFLGPGLKPLCALIQNSVCNFTECKPTSTLHNLLILLFSNKTLKFHPVLSSLRIFCIFKMLVNHKEVFLFSRFSRLYILGILNLVLAGKLWF